MKTLVFLLALALPCAAIAQPTTSVASARGARLRVQVVRDDSVGVDGAELIVKDGKVEHQTRTDSAGKATFDGLGSGRLILLVRRIGFKDARLFPHVEEGDNAVTIHLDGAVATLDEVRIVGNRRVAGRLDDFEMRLRAGEANAVVTRAQIEKRNPVALSQMLRGIPGIRIADSSGSHVAVTLRGKNPTHMSLNDCVLRVSVDGVVVPGRGNIDDIVPFDVYAVEVFLGPARTPLQMGGLRHDSWCGLIAIWTRSGEPPDR